MGFERLCMVMQGTKSNYDTDVFQPMIRTIGDIAGVKYGDSEEKDVAMRVIADHVRAIAFSIADGQLPSNAKAGYVIRRILRRAVRYGFTFLDLKEAFMYRLVDTLIESMGEAYPELPAQADLIKHVIKEEEDSFLRTLATGIKMIEGIIAEAKKEGKTQIQGVQAFTLYDTYGFPFDLTELILKENGMTVSEEEFNAEMAKQKARARNAAQTETTDWVNVREGNTEFVGYDLLECDTEILRYRKVTQKNSSYYQVVLSRTPFYAEMGGQVGDKGTLTAGDEVVEVTNTKRENNLPVHIVKKLPTDVTATFKAAINKEARMAISCNHSATHLLHAALREVLGTHVEQKGSQVDAKMLRFDFSHFKKLSLEEIREVERRANAMIRRAIPLEEHRNMPIAEAKALGAMALFGEKYGDSVRVVKFGQSVELCGGTHVANTGNIGFLKIVSESSIAAGIRRIEAITGAAVEDFIYDAEDVLIKLRALFNNAPDVVSAVARSLNENTSLQKQVEGYMMEAAKNVKENVYKHATDIAGIRTLKIYGVYDPNVVKAAVYMVKSDAPENTVLLAATRMHGKPTLTIFVSDDLVKKGMNAGKMIREAAKAIQGGGGGQPGFAQAGGRNEEGISLAMEKMEALIAAEA